VSAKVRSRSEGIAAGGAACVAIGSGELGSSDAERDLECPFSIGNWHSIEGAGLGLNPQLQLNWLCVPLVTSERAGFEPSLLLRAVLEPSLLPFVARSRLREPGGAGIGLVLLAALPVDLKLELIVDLEVQAPECWVFSIVHVQHGFHG